MKQPGILNAVLVDKSHMTLLNKRHRKKNGPTDVLSFTYDDFGDLRGEVIICVDVVRETARRQHKCFSSIMHKLFVHGTLHVLGYDHEDDHDYRVMKLFEIKTLNLFESRAKKSTKN